MLQTRNRAPTADAALRLSCYFGLSERSSLNLQSRYDLETEKEKLEGRIEEEVGVKYRSEKQHHQSLERTAESGGSTYRPA